MRERSVLKYQRVDQLPPGPHGTMTVRVPFEVGIGAWDRYLEILQRAATAGLDYAEIFREGWLRRTVVRVSGPADLVIDWLRFKERAVDE